MPNKALKRDAPGLGPFQRFSCKFQLRGFARAPLPGASLSFNVMHKVKQPLKFSRFGSDNGRIVIYFHGAPGAPEECGIFDLNGKKHGLTFICFGRFSFDSSINGETYYKLLAEEISKKAAGKQGK